MDRASHPDGKTLRLSADTAGVKRAARLLDGGRLVAVPTETVYGLAARADRDESVAAIYRAKGRPDFNPLIVHVSDIEAAGRIAMLDPRALALAKRFWPGPLTVVLPLRADAEIAPAVTAGLTSVAVRCPAHPVMRALLIETGVALAAPSANRSGGVSPTRAEHVLASLGGRIDAVIDGGRCPAGIESTIAALRPHGSWEVLRPGPIAAEAIAEVLGTAPTVSAPNTVEAPGQLSSHYAPGKPVRLDATGAGDDEFLIGFGSIEGDFNLSPASDCNEAASRLYAALHEAAASPMPRVAVAPVPEEGIGLALNDRLRRAAA